MFSPTFGHSGVKLLDLTCEASETDSADCRTMMQTSSSEACLLDSKRWMDK